MIIDLTVAQADGLAKAVAEFNARVAEGDQLTSEQYAIKEFGVLADQWAKRATEIPSADFVLRFPPAKMAAIIAACEVHAELAAAMVKLRAEPIAHLANDLVINSLAALQGAGLLTREEVLAINPYQP